MNSSQPLEKDEKSKADAMLRRMGMSLSILGAILFSAGLVAYRLCADGIPDVRCILILASGVAMFASGLYIWLCEKRKG